MGTERSPKALAYNVASVPMTSMRHVVLTWEHAPNKPQKRAPNIPQFYNTFEVYHKLWIPIVIDEFRTDLEEEWR